MPRLIADRAVLHTTSELARVMAAARAREHAGRARLPPRARRARLRHAAAHRRGARARRARPRTRTTPTRAASCALREALVAKLARENGIAAHPDDVVVTVGGTHGLYLAMQALLGPGDELLVLSPHWMAIPKLVALRRRRDASRAARLPRAALGRVVARRLRRARCARRCGPRRAASTQHARTTPPASCSTREQLAAIADVAIERDLWVLSDEAYEHLLFDGARHVSIGLAAGHGGAHGLRLHALEELRDDRLARRLRARARGAARGAGARGSSFYTTHGVFAAVQAAALAAVTGPQDCVEVMRRAYDERAACCSRASRAPGVRVPVPRGAFYAFPDVSGVLAGRGRAGARRRLARARRRGAARHGVRRAHASHVRLSLATRREDIAEAVRRLAG